jgi:hypothetical protein
VLIILTKGSAYRRKAEDDQEEVKSIQRPASKA